MSMAGQQSRVSLFVAVKNGNLQDVIDCVESGCSVDVRDGTTAEATALYVACKCNRLDICEFLLQSGADVNAQTKWRSTPLHVASDRGHTGCAFRLLLFGADVNVMNRRGETALHLSAKRGHVMTVELLVGAGAKLHVRDKGGLTPQRAAEVERQDDTVGVLSRVKDTLGYLRKRFQDDKIKLGLVLEKSYSSCQSVLGRGTPRLDLAWKALVQLPVQWQNEIAAVFREQVEDTDLMAMCEERKQRLETQSWVLGVDYTIKGGAPVGNGVWDRHLKSISLLFEINHNLYGSMMLKVLIGLNQKGNGQRRVKMDTKHRDDIFSTLPSHPHVARVIHRFEAETMAFKCFVPSTVSSQLHRDITLEKFATCLVTDRYPLCLKCIYNFLCEHVKPGEPWSDAVGETFLILVTIQALKGIRHLHMHGISNSRISMENVLVDNQMRVVITDNIQNPQFHHHLQDSCITEDSCIPEDETIKSACTECPDVCTLAETIEALMHPPTDIGEDKVDASSLTHSQEDLRQDEDTLVTETSIECNYSQILTHLLTRMKSDDQSISTDVGNSLIYAGAILFFRDCRKLENKEELRCWTTANLISQTLLSPENSGWTQDGHHLRMQICNVSLEGRKTLDTLRRQFLCETTCDQLWSAYQWSGEVDVVNKTTKELCRLKYHAYSYFSREEPRRVTGVVYDANEQPRIQLYGTWDKVVEFSWITGSYGGKNSTKLPKSGIVVPAWTRTPPRHQSETVYGFDEFACQLNEPEEGIASTDSRLRPDLRLMENQDYDSANAKKLNLEEKQRARRRQREAALLETSGGKEKVQSGGDAGWKPVWFKNEMDPLTNMLTHVYKGGYWERKKQNDWSNLPELW